MKLEIIIQDQKVDKVYKCAWRRIYEANAQGIGTSFNPDSDLECKVCDGYEKGCRNYLQDDSRFVKASYPGV